MIDIFTVPVPEPMAIRHAAQGGRDLSMYQADLGGDEYLSVASAREPVDGLKFHVSVCVKSKLMGERIRPPNLTEVDLVIEYFGRTAASLEITRDGDVVNLWEK